MIHSQIKSNQIKKKLQLFSHSMTVTFVFPLFHIGSVAFAGLHGPNDASMRAVAFTIRFASVLVPHLIPKANAWLCYRGISIDSRYTDNVHRRTTSARKGAV